MGEKIYDHTKSIDIGLLRYIHSHIVETLRSPGIIFSACWERQSNIRKLFEGKTFPICSLCHLCIYEKRNVGWCEHFIQYQYNSRGCGEIIYGWIKTNYIHTVVWSWISPFLCSWKLKKNPPTISMLILYVHWCATKIPKWVKHFICIKVMRKYRKILYLYGGILIMVYNIMKWMFYMV